jgi:hypothetical protein
LFHIAMRMAFCSSAAMPAHPHRLSFVVNPPVTPWEFSFVQFWSKPMSNEKNQQPDGTKPSPIAIGMALGMALGAGLGAALNNIALGVALGLAIGLTLGAAIDQQRKNKGE